eukprot:SAG31_NODE_1311_length_8869_cov_10.603535_6_plen_212_part_00
MGATFQRLLKEAEQMAAAEGAAEGTEARRKAEIQSARAVWKTGFVADAIAEHCAAEHYNEQRKEMERGLLTKADIAAYSATTEPPLTYEYAGWTVAKCGPWSQAPVFLQQLALLKGVEGFDKMAPDSPEFVHTVVEAAKLAFADREAYYADPLHVDVPLQVLLSDKYNDERRKLINPKKAAPGLVPGLATGDTVDGAGDGSALLGSSVRKM